MAGRKEQHLPSSVQQLLEGLVTADKKLTYFQLWTTHKNSTNLTDFKFVTKHVPDVHHNIECVAIYETQSVQFEAI